MRVFQPLRPAPRRGTALVASVIVITSLMALGLSFVMVALGSSRALDASVEDRRAFYLAEGVMAEALTALRAGATGAIGSQASPARLGNSACWTEVTDLGGDLRSLRATALQGSGRAALEVVVSVSGGETSLFNAMILSDDKLSIDSNQTIDSYDSSLGTYASQAIHTLGGKVYANANGSVASNADIVVSSNTTIFGDATAGVGDSISLDSGVVVTGSTAPAKKPFEMPVLEAPDLNSMGTLNVSGTQTLTAGSYRYGSLKINANAKLIVKGPALIVSGQFTTNDKSKIEIDATGGPVTFFNTGNFKYNQTTTISTSSGSPADVVFAFDSANKIVFPGGITFLGGIYAPNAPVTIDSNSTFYGAIVAKSITMSAGTKFHFDEYLLKRTRTSEGGGSVQVLSWNPTPVPKEFQTDRRDPFLLLGLDRNQLPAPADAWDLDQ